mmetsp:Transcript_19539/g.75014  ORF Transcript_19539/g.75014 Transcript_19539/m.75014 type:complete len:238 (+) Transcript_19539:50-763(+)
MAAAVDQSISLGRNAGMPFGAGTHRPVTVTRAWSDGCMKKSAGAKSTCCGNSSSCPAEAAIRKLTQTVRAQVQKTAAMAEDIKALRWTCKLLEQHTNMLEVTSSAQGHAHDSASEFRSQLATQLALLRERLDVQERAHEYLAGCVFKKKQKEEGPSEPLKAKITRAANSVTDRVREHRSARHRATAVPMRAVHSSTATNSSTSRERLVTGRADDSTAALRAGRINIKRSRAARPSRR